MLYVHLLDLYDMIVGKVNVQVVRLCDMTFTWIKCNLCLCVRGLCILLMSDFLGCKARGWFVSPTACGVV
jgi:hypothetical protein